MNHSIISRSASRKAFRVRDGVSGPLLQAGQSTMDPHNPGIDEQANLMAEQEHNDLRAQILTLRAEIAGPAGRG